MLQTARASIAREAAADRVRVAQADATSFDPQTLFNTNQFDRIVISYALSMMPNWEMVLQHAVGQLAPCGALCVVDFGDLADLPRWFRQGVFAWLKRFSVTPRLDVFERLSDMARAADLTCRFRKIYKGYAVLGELRVP